jgi:hypothetical protein
MSQSARRARARWNATRRFPNETGWGMSLGKLAALVEGR